jgi:two-component system CheB/CheR fusion protein
MNAHLISRLASAAADQQTIRSAKSILSAVSSQVQIIDDLLDLSRANTGKVALSPKLLAMDELVRSIATAAGADAKAKNQILTLEIQPARIFGDRARVEQIIWNLVTNAVKFTPEGGALRIELTADGDAAKLVVQDNGIGLDSGHLTDVFEMFKQIETPVGRANRGLGIGLALVKQLTELHGGRVAAESKGIGNGARFTVWLPVATGESSSRLPALDQTASVSGLKLLIVDDEPDQLFSLGELLETEGARVERSNSAEQAFELATVGQFDAIVSDISMPGRDGYWLANQLRQDARTRDIAVVAMSGIARVADRARAIDAGFDGMVGKPFDPDTLQSAIVRIRAKRSADRG